MIWVAFRCTRMIVTLAQIKPVVKGCAHILTTNGFIKITYINLKITYIKLKKRSLKRR